MPQTPYSPLYTSAPAVAIIDQNNSLTLSWTPTAGSAVGDLVSPLFTAYDHWDITTQVTAPVLLPALSTVFLAPGAPNFLGGSQTYTQTLSPGTVTLTMQAWHTAPPEGGSSVYLTNPWQTSGSNVARQFPDAISATNVLFSLTSVLLNQPLTVTLAPGYASQAGNAATQWQVIWPDSTSTGWLPLTSNAVTKQFTTPGSANVVIQTRANYNGSQYAPPTTLIRQTTQQILVVNQQASSSSSSTAGLTGSLGIGGQQGFEIVGTTGGSVAPEPWEVIVRCIVRDTITNELKLLVGTSRFSNASSLYGTMAADVFPMEGRPHAKELIQPPYELTVTSQTETVPVAILTSTLPTLIVGKSVTEALQGGTLQMQTSGTSGIAPFIWSSSGLPDGLTLNGSGIIGGTPLELGTFQVTFTVQDSSVPFSVAETTLPLIVETDLLVEIAANQKDATGSVLAQLGTSLGVAQVNTPYSVQMQVGNINPAVPTPGGLPPYTWSIPAGALPIGLSINPSTGLISGSPSTYNSTTDFNTTFSATVQVSDAIGAKATQTYTMTLIPAVLQYGLLDQTTIFAGQQFKLVVPVFGGVSPYTLVSVVPLSVGDDPYYSLPAQLVDGQIEVDVNFPQTSVGQHSFQVTVNDSATPITTVATAQFTFNVEAQISDPFFVPAFLDHVWQSLTDTAKPTPIALTGNLSGFSLAGLNVGVNAVMPSAGTGIYSVTGATCSFGGGAGNAYAGLTFAVSGFANSNNNGTFLCSASGGSPQTITLLNPNAATEAIVTDPAGIGLTLTQATPVTGSVLNPAAPFQDLIVYAGTITGGAGNAYAGQQFAVTGFANAGNNGTFYCVQSTITTLTLASSTGVAEAHAGSATQMTAKAIQVNTLSSTNPLSNGITVTIDPVIPEVEFAGPPSGIVGNAQYTIPVQLQFGGATQATVSQSYTVLATNATTPGDIGAMAITTRPYLYGAGLNELVGLNPRKPWYNSPNIPAITPSPAPTDAPWIATVAAGSALPPGLNLDANTGLVYGNLVGAFSARSIINYVGSTGTVHGTATISWASPTIPSSFQLIDNIQDGLPLGSAYPATSYIAVPAGTTPASANLFGPSRLPAGLTQVFTISGQNVLITGTPIEAGFFDTWFQVVATNGQSSFLRHRFSIDFLPPLTIVTTTLPNADAGFYGPEYVQAIGGVTNSLGQYQWSLGTLPLGAVLSINSTTGAITGTLSAGGPTTFAIPVIVTDYSPSGLPGPGNVTTTTTVSIFYNTALRITTAEIATVTPDPVTGYSFQMQAAGGTPPYQWEISPAANLPTGIVPVNGTSWNGSFVAASSTPPGGGWFYGTAGASITNIAETSGSVVTLTVSSNNFLQVGSQVRLSGLTVGTWLNGHTVTLIAPVSSTILTFIDPTSHGTQVSTPETGTAAWAGGSSGYTPNPTVLSITVKDSVAATATAPFNMETGAYILTPSDAGVGPIPPGFAYQGTLSAAGLCTQPQVQWEVAPTPQYSNQLPSGLSLSVNGDGTTATISGTYSGAAIPQLTPYNVRFVAVDSVGNTGEVVHPFYTHSNIAIAGWGIPPAPPNPTIAFPLPNAIIGPGGNWSYNGIYSGPIQLVVANGVGPFVWGVGISSPGGLPLSAYGLSLSTSGATAGQITNTLAIATVVPQTFTFTVTDSLGNTASLPLAISSQTGTLSISTASIGAFLAGTAYTTSNDPAGLPLAATPGVAPYTFSISPLNANPLPTGLTLTAAGYITGTTIQGGYSKPVTFRVTDHVGSISDKVLTVSVTAVLALYSGIDYTDWGVGLPVPTGNPRDGAWSSGTSYVVNDIALLGVLSYRCILANIGVTPPNAVYWQQVGVLGFVDKGNVSSVNPRPNLSFYVKATGVVSTSPSQITVTTSDPSVTGTVTALVTTPQTSATIQLTGPFANGVAGTYPLSVTVVDSGISITGVFTWTVFDDGALTLAPTTGSLPTQALG